MPANPTIWTADRVQRVRELRESGVSRGEIAALMGVAPHNITYVIHKHDLASWRPKLSKATFVEAVTSAAFRYGVSPDEIVGRGRWARMVRARQAVMHELHRRGYSLPQIGKRLGRDHSTVWSGIRAHEKRQASRASSEATLRTPIIHRENLAVDVT